MTGNRSTEQLMVRPRGRGIAVWAWVSTRDGVVRHGEGTVTGVAVVKERTGILGNGPDLHTGQQVFQKLE